MPRSILEDIKPLTKKNSHPTASSEERSEENFDAKHEEISQPTYEEEYYGEPPHRPSFFLWIITGGSIILFLFALSFFFSGAQVTITPKHETDTLQQTVTVYKNPTDGQLPFDIMSVDGQDSVTVAATEQANIAAKATGTVTIYNNYSLTSQKLVATTRLQAANGNIYRITKEVTVPGQMLVSGKTAPGSVDVAVVADQTGDTYNLASGDFTIPGFKGGPRYAKFSASVKTPIAGGASGTGLSASADDLAKAKADLSKKISDTLTAQAFSQIPQGYVAYSTATVLTEPPTGPDQQITDGVDTLSEKATLSVFLFPEKPLTSFVVSTALKSTDPLPSVTVPNIKELAVAPAEPITGDPTTLTELKVTISGDAKIVWDVDEQSIVDMLRGKTKKEFDSIMATVPSVDKAELSLTPFWIGTISKNARDITTTVTNPYQ